MGDKMKTKLAFNTSILELKKCILLLLYCKRRSVAMNQYLNSARFGPFADRCPQ